MSYEISAKKKVRLGFAELLQYRELLSMLILRDFKIKYAQTFMGILWTVIQPVLTLLIFTLIFGKFIKIDTGGIPYPIFALCGLLAWNYFSYVMTQAGNSIIGAQSLITKIYFPRLIIPLSKTLFGLIDLAITFVFLGGLLFYYSFIPSQNIIFLPFFMILLILFSASIGIWLSALSIRYRDVQYMVPFIVQLGLYITPVVYPSEKYVPAKFMVLYYCNPISGIIDGFRWSIIGNTSINFSAVALNTLFIIVLFFAGIYYFRKVENKIADII